MSSGSCGTWPPRAEPEFLQRRLRTLRQHAPETLAQIRAAFASEDREALGGLAHGLKSMSYNIGAARVAQAALGLQRLVRIEEKMPEAGDLQVIASEIAAALAAAGAHRPGRRDRTGAASGLIAGLSISGINRHGGAKPWRGPSRRRLHLTPLRARRSAHLIRIAVPPGPTPPGIGMSVLP